MPTTRSVRAIASEAAVVQTLAAGRREDLAMTRSATPSPVDSSPATERGMAICVAGEPRSLALPCVHRAMRSRFLEPLSAALPGQVALVLLLTSNNDSNMSSVPWVKGGSSHSEQALREAGTPKSTYQPHEPLPLKRALDHIRGTGGLESLDVQRKLGESPCSKLTQPCVVTGAASPSTSSFLAQQVVWEACLRAVEQLEARRGARFAHVVRTRPDLWWEAPLDAASFMRHLASGGARVAARYDRYRRDCEVQAPSAVEKPYLFISDWLVATTREYAHSSLGWLRDYCARCSRDGSFTLEPPPPQELFTAEGLLSTRLATLSPRNGTIAPLHASLIRVWDQRRYERASRADVAAMSQFARWAGVSCDVLDRECFGGQLRRAALGFCTESSGRALARRMDQACGASSRGLACPVILRESGTCTSSSASRGARNQAL